VHGGLQSIAAPDAPSAEKWRDGAARCAWEGAGIIPHPEWISMLHWVHRLVLVGVAASLSPAAASAAVAIDFVPVGSPGNAADPQTGRGAVAYPFAIGRTEVTNAQYVEFLNAKAASDPLLLWNPNMMLEAGGGIDRSGEDGRYRYAAKPGHGNQPVTWVSWYDAARFANWLHNGQGAGDTERGAYTFTEHAPNPQRVIEREPGARVFLPSRDEWYKAAVFDPSKPGGPGYWDYPTRTDAVPYSAPPPGTAAPNPANVANFFKNDGMANGYDNGLAVTGRPESGPGEELLTDAGAYPLSASAFGTLDQAGNVYEWDEGFRPSPNRVFRGISGGNLASDAQGISSDPLPIDNNAFTEIGSIGFRVATLPEPAAGMALLGGAVMFLKRRRNVVLVSRRRK
jgi:formylglycine-generating enzyme